jgi:hypothetical protein
LFFFKSYVASYGYVRRPGTDRIPEGVPKKFLRNRNRDSCEKSATGEENTGILRIPAGITNLGDEEIAREYDKGALPLVAMPLLLHVHLLVQGQGF